MSPRIVFADAILPQAPRLHCPRFVNQLPLQQVGLQRLRWVIGTDPLLTRVPGFGLPMNQPGEPPPALGLQGFSLGQSIVGMWVSSRLAAATTEGCGLRQLSAKMERSIFPSTHLKGGMP